MRSYLPEGTSVNIAPYIMHHNEKYFSPAPDTFWPDRWLKKSSSEKLVDSPLSTGDEKSLFTHNTSAFIPFSAGHANCAGKNLALAEMRMVTALLMQRFDIRFAPGYDVSRWEREFVDLFVLKPSELPVVITLRS